jgi:hypothetical protein
MTKTKLKKLADSIIKKLSAKELSDIMDLYESGRMWVLTDILYDEDMKNFPKKYIIEKR